MNKKIPCLLIIMCTKRVAKYKRNASTNHEQQDSPVDTEEQHDPFAIREEPSTVTVALPLTSNGSTSRNPWIPGHTGLTSCPSGRGWMEKCGANLLSRSSWDVDAGIAIEQQAYIVWRGRRRSNVTSYQQSLGMKFSL